MLGCIGVVSAEESTGLSSDNRNNSTNDNQEGDNIGSLGDEDADDQGDKDTDDQGDKDADDQGDKDADDQGDKDADDQGDKDADDQGDEDADDQGDKDADDLEGSNTENNTTTPTPITTTPTTTTTPIPKKDLEASISANVTKGSVPLTVNFTAEVDDSLIAEYQWDVHEDEGYMNGRSVEYTYKEAGEYTVTLILTPKDTTTYSKTEITKTITVTQEKLEAIISVSADEGVAPLQITFTGTAKGNPVSWEWDFDDGSSLIKNQTKVEHSFTKAGVYNVRLTIRNETGSTASTTKQIEVTEKPTTTTTTATKTTTPTTVATTVQAVKSASISADDSPIPNPLDIIEELIRLLKVMLVPENYSLA